MTIEDKLKELDERDDNLLDMDETAYYLDDSECEIAYKIDRGEIEDYCYNYERYVPKDEVIRILESRL